MSKKPKTKKKKIADIITIIIGKIKAKKAKEKK